MAPEALAASELSWGGGGGGGGREGEGEGEGERGGSCPQTRAQKTFSSMATGQDLCEEGWGRRLGGQFD